MTDQATVKVVETSHWPPLIPPVEEAPKERTKAREKTPTETRDEILARAEFHAQAALDNLELGIEWFRVAGSEVKPEVLKQVENLLETIRYRRGL